MGLRLTCFIVFVILFSGCTSSSLSRGKAKDVIEASDSFKVNKRHVFLTKGEYDDLGRAGYLLYRRAFPEYELLVGPNGRGLIDSGSLGPHAWGAPGTRPSVVLSTPIKAYVVEVTGITASENGAKIVKYRWNWDFSAQPKELQAIFKDHPVAEATATLRIYDDGWRAEWEKQETPF